MSNPIQYTSRTFLQVINDINNDPQLVDKPEWFKRMIAGSHDVISIYQNAIANQSFLRTAFTRQAVADLLTLIDYHLSWKTTASGTLLFYLSPTTVFPKTIDVEDLKARSSGTIAVASKVYEARAGVTQAPTSEGFTTDFASDNNLDVAREYMTGEKVRVSTDDTLPAPLAAGTDYYVIKKSDTEITLAESLAECHAGTEITLTSDGTGNHTITLLSVRVTCYQQETQEDVSLGTSDGVTEWQQFDLPDLNIISDTLTLTINAQSWTVVDNLVESSSTDRHFLHIYNTDGSSYIIFGDGTYGAIPGNFEIFADYAFGGGAESNITTADRINSYGGSDIDVLGVSNPSAFTGGADEENLESAKLLGPTLLKARDRFVTVEDGEALALAYGGIIRVKVNKNVYGLLSAQVPIVPAGGGSPSAGLKSALQTYLIDRTVLDSIDVRVEDPTYNAVSITSAIKVLTGYTFADIKDYIVLAFRLIFSEVTYEIQQEYEQNGIADAIEYINNKWSTSFTSADNTQIITLLENIEPANFGTDFQESDVLTVIDAYVEGVDYLTIAAPAFPITQADDEITQDDIDPMNITEIV